MIFRRVTNKIFLALLLLALTGMMTLHSSDLILPSQFLTDSRTDSLELDLRFTANPNPFDEFTMISVYLGASNRGEIIIRDRFHNVVNNLYSGDFKQGLTQIMWFGTDNHGNQLNPGNYQCELVLEGRYTSRTIILILK